MPTAGVPPSGWRGVPALGSLRVAGPGWLRLLAAEGWRDAVAIPDDDPLGHKIFMARRP